MESKLLKIVQEEVLEKFDKLKDVQDKILDQVKKKIMAEERSSYKALPDENGKREELPRMIKLFARLENGLDPLVDFVMSSITSMGNKVLEQRKARLDREEKYKNNDPVFVEELFVLHEKYSDVIMRDFAGQYISQKMLKDAFYQNVGKHMNAELM